MSCASFWPAAQRQPSAHDIDPLPIAPVVSTLHITGTVRNAGLELRLARLDFWDILPDGSQPSRDYFLVMTGALTHIEDGSSSHCAGARDLHLLVGEQRYPVAEKLRAANQHYHSEYPGFILPQCLTSYTSSAPTFFIFDVAEQPGRLLLSFHNALLQLPASLPELKAAGAAREGRSVQATPTARATPVPTRTATLTSTITLSPTATLSPTVTLVPTTAPTPDLAMAEAAIVIHVVDAVTVDVLIDNRQQRVRYLLIDAPAPEDPLFDTATDANFKLVGWQTIYLVKDMFDGDEGSLLRYVYLMDGTHVNAELVRQGYARVDLTAPNSSRIEELHAAEAEARAAGRGLWTSPPAQTQP